MLVVVTFAAALVVGAIIVIATRCWCAIRMTTITEHVAPATAARLQAEGVRDPDRRLTELVERAHGESERGLRETLSNRYDDQAAAPEDDPARVTVEQETTMTPASRPGRAPGVGAGAEGASGPPAARTLVAWRAAVVAVVAFMVVVGFVVGAL
jgi:hypothetical protein